MSASFFFYDLETTGVDRAQSRIMQFAGQRTDLDLNPIGEPINILVKLTPDVVPDPDAILLTGITPQQTLADGVTEAEFLNIFYEEVVKPETVFLGFNSVRFDDEFMRFAHYRNFHDPYGWHFVDNCSRWDLLDLVRMTRALRPEGIEWPFTEEGKPVNRLQLLTSLNNLEHTHAHDALSDVNASIALARMLRDKSPKLFGYLFETREKNNVKKLVDSGQPFVYTSGKYPSETLHTTMAVKLADQPYGYALVYDLRQDPADFMGMTDSELADACRWSKEVDRMRLPVKIIRPNHCPAVAPPGVVKDIEVQARLGLDMAAVSVNLRKLKANPAFAAKVARATEIIGQESSALSAGDSLLGHVHTVDGELYAGFPPDADKFLMRRIQSCEPSELNDLCGGFQDKRLKTMARLYKARNFSSHLDDEERAEWDAFCRQRLMGGGKNSNLAKYFQRLQELAADPKLTPEQRYLLEELQLYGESIMPITEEADAAVA